MPEAGLEYVRKLRDVKYNETIFDILARQFEIAKLDEAKEGALIQVVDPALPPDRKSFPKRGLIVLIATIAGLLVGYWWLWSEAGWNSCMCIPESEAKLALLRNALRSGRAPAG